MKSECLLADNHYHKGVIILDLFTAKNSTMHCTLSMCIVRQSKHEMIGGSHGELIYTPVWSLHLKLMNGIV